MDMNPSRMNFIFHLVLLFVGSFCLFSSANGTLAGGRPNTFSVGRNAFAGVVNPANAVWIEDRFDVGAFWLHQKLSIDNRDDNPFFLPGKTDYTYRRKNILTVDAAVHKLFKSNSLDYSIGIAYYTTPTILKLHTKKPNPISGTTPLSILNNVQAISMIFSFKLNDFHSIGATVDYFHFSHLRNGFQRSDNPMRSVSPGHVTNKGMDHSNGISITLGWRWKITQQLDFGAAWSKKSYCGQYRKYRGFEPHHAKNYTPQAVGAGFTYRFNSKIAGQFEVLWVNSGNLPSSNNNILRNGKLNLHKRGSNKSPGPGQQDATFINCGIGYKINSILSVGGGLSHRIKLHRSSIFISHTYAIQTTYNVISIGSNIKYKKHDVYLLFTYGLNNRVTGKMPKELGGGKFSSDKRAVSFSFSWGYEY